ncbi:MAG: IgGFc-binding protein [Labilithrix sp.]|nr:IgGFc-binding protein [Labilithrix sp.]
MSNAGNEPARLSVARGDKQFILAPSTRQISGENGLDPEWTDLPNDTLAPGASAVIFLVEGTELALAPSLCPVPPLEPLSAFVPRGGLSPFIRLTSTEPVFATYFYGYGLPEGAYVSASSALRATGSWSTEFVDVGILQPGRTDIQEDFLGFYDAKRMVGFAAVLAKEPTRIEFAVDGGVEAEVIPGGWVRRLERDDLFIGTPIKSDHPVGLFVGAPMALMPYNVGSADNIISQVAPPSAWGSEYAAVGYPPRKRDLDDPALFRIVAANAGTALTYDPARPPGAPERLEAGQLAVFKSASAFVVRSQDTAHPIYVSVAMTGSVTACEIVPPPPDERDAGEGDTIYRECIGDPELVSVPPPAEFATRFAFVAPHYYPVTNLVLVRKRAASGNFADVTLDCAGVIQGWKPIDDGGIYETVTLPLSAGNYEPQAYPGGSCGLGPHTLSSSGPVSGYLWGWSHAGADPNPDDDGRARSYGFALYGIDPDKIIR